ncbi:MAG TPA: S41 family peptidase [Vicinamibacterales bacterium]|nr:S41 family peptidase [Vicinamibacterales bacterium]
MHRISAVVFTAFITVLVPVAAAQAPATPSGRDEVIRAIASRFETTYVFPDVGARVRPELEKRIQAGAYRDIPDGQAFADALTHDLRTITGDQHVRVGYSKEPFPPMNEAPQPPSPRSPDDTRRQMAALNFGFVKVERLPGNVGFVDLDFFADPELGGATAAAAMSFVAETDALIVDLRFNGGGNSRMVALLASYLFDSEPQHLNDIVVPRENLLKQSWTLPHVAGRKFGRTKPVYILTSARTFSAAEEFAYDLQALGRATIVGEKTRGGANPSGRFRISDHYAAIVPTAQAVNPHTKSNWEGTGVAPELAVPSGDALRTAQIRILERLIQHGDADLREDRVRRKEVLEKETPMPRPELQEQKRGGDAQDAQHNGHHASRV